MRYIVVHSFFGPVRCSKVSWCNIFCNLLLILCAQRTGLVARRLLDCWQDSKRLGWFVRDSPSALILRFPVGSWSQTEISNLIVSKETRKSLMQRTGPTSPYFQILFLTWYLQLNGEHSTLQSRDKTFVCCRILLVYKGVPIKRWPWSTKDPSNSRVNCSA